MPWRLCRFLQRQQEKLYVETPQTTLALSSALLLSAKGYTETQNIAKCALSETEFDLFWMEYHFGPHVAASALWLNAGCLGNFLSQLGHPYMSVCWLSVCFFLSYSPPVYLSQLVSRGLKKMFLKTGWQHTDMVHISQCQAPTYTVTCSTISIWIILQGQINTFKWFLVAKYVTWVEIFFTSALLFYQRKADNTH